MPPRGKTGLNKQTQTFFKISGIIITGFIGALLGIWIFGTSTVNIEGMTIKTTLAPSRSGITEIHLPPFGVIEAKTHKGPVKLSMTLEQIETDSLKTHLNQAPNSKEFMQRLRQRAEESVWVIALRQIFIAMIAAFCFILFIWRPGWKQSLLQALLCTFLTVIFLWGSFHSFDARAFNEPEYKGVISMAPSVMEFANKSLTDLELIKENTEKVVANLGELFASADHLMVMADPEGQEQAVKILLVSDLHSNPVGVKFMKGLADTFQVDFIINAGDLTDLGSMQEASLLDEMKSITVPQLLVAGNHDNPQILNMVADMENAHILNGQTVSIKEITVLGFADPLASGQEVEYENSAKKKQALEEAKKQISAEIEKQGPPDILVVHNYNLARSLISQTPLLVAGHDHRLRIEQKKDSILINPGTTGAAGLRGFYSEEGKAYSAVIIYLTPNSGLLAVDLIEYSPVSKQFSMNRELVNTP